MQIKKVILVSGLTLEKRGTWTHNDESGDDMFEFCQFFIIRSFIQTANT